MHAHVQRQKQVAKAIVSRCRIILNEIARDNHAIGTPIAVLVMIENTLQRVLRVGAAQLAIGTGEQMRIRNVQDPYQVAIFCIRVRLNTQYP